MRTVYLNGAFLPESEAKVSAYDLGVMQAAAVFDMTRSFNGVHFRLAEHLDRLEGSCHVLGFPVPDRKEVEEAIGQLTILNDHGPGEEHRLLIMVSPGPSKMYRAIAGDHPTMLITDFPLRYTTAGLGRQFAEGGSAMISTVRQVPDDCVPSHIKHRSRLHFYRAKQEAIQNGVDWAILLDREFQVAECPGANVFIVEDHGRSPSGTQLIACSGSCLPGISRQTVLNLALMTWNGYYEERHCGVQHLFGAREIFVTGTPFCLLPITRLNGNPVGDGKPGPIYQRLLSAWSEMVGVDIAGQIKAWDAPCQIV